MQHLIDHLNAKGPLDVLADPTRIESPGFMPLVIEAIGSNAYYHPTLPLVSVAHYGELNGDLMRDPEVVFAATLGEHELIAGLEPVYYRNDYIGIEQCVYDGTIRNEKLARDIAAFTATWNDELKAQGFFGPAEGDARAGMFARLGTWANVQEKMKEAGQNRAAIVHDKDAGTVVATLHGRTVFRAMSKGDGIWLVIYSRAFYSTR